MRVFSKFLGQQVVRWSEQEVIFQEDIIYLISQVIVFYKGAISYKEIKEMPLAELDMLIKAQNKIVKQNVV